MNKQVVSMIVCSVLLFSSTPVLAGNSDRHGREVLGKTDGWASFASGTTGGAAADEAHVFTAANRTELMQALGGDNATNRMNSTPKIIYVKGTIDINTDDSGKPLGMEDYKDPSYDFQQYLSTYAPEAWGKTEVTGPLEDARARSAKNQKDHIVINIGSNTTLIGVEDNAKIIGGAISVKGVDNVIVRNIEFVAPIDYFPAWDPLDGDEGNWNSEYDGLTIDASTHVWVNQNTFGDGDHTDTESGTYFGRKFMQHDGLLDIKNGSDYVTVSHNLLQDHDKVTLVGSSDTSKIDGGHLKVTFHHNHLKNLSQRTPRVRFGEVHIYNNYYQYNQGSDYDFSYAWGVGVNSKTYAENNFFEFDYEADISKVIGQFKGTSIFETGSIVKTPGGVQRDVDLVKAYNDENSVQLNENVGWEPTLHDHIDTTDAVRGKVRARAGAGKLR
ncbi:pectate lyase family protein [Paenibacillus xerothermodurans]|uniref:Pectate lyase n=1 Tax=Paenibacillus xerothermodurans TaxID=1977292 RepID=A0A2W1NR47_PAEXE|nr:pectate lyase [Paenibacillus xerothermodurans]PZE21343.1 pectate lyase [Paenibacillus xerothermodurans]